MGLKVEKAGSRLAAAGMQSKGPGRISLREPFLAS